MLMKMRLPLLKGSLPVWKYATKDLGFAEQRAGSLAHGEKVLIGQARQEALAVQRPPNQHSEMQRRQDRRRKAETVQM